MEQSDRTQEVGPARSLSMILVVQLELILLGTLQVDFA